MGKDCTLNYPTALVLNKKEVLTEHPLPANENSSIQIGENANIKGMVIYLGKQPPNNYRPQIIIEENVAIKGEIYCEGNLELKGSVLGTVFTSNFVANQSGSAYQNHIYNGTIIMDKLPQEYIGLPLEDSKKGVMKWLY